jgi:hypothetical protein
MKRFVLFVTNIALLATLQFMWPPAAFAGNADFEQRILPLDCVFETVDAGTGLLYYVTPAACGVVISVPAPPEPGNTSSGTQAVTKVIGPIPQGSVAIVPGSQSRQILLPGGWRPLASLSGNNNLQTANEVKDSWVAGAVALCLMAIAFVFGRLLL